MHLPKKLLTVILLHHLKQKALFIVCFGHTEKTQNIPRIKLLIHRNNCGTRFSHLHPKKGTKNIPPIHQLLIVGQWQIPIR